MKTKNILTGIITVVIAMLAGACNDYLDTVQHGALSKDQFYKTDDDAKSANANVYASLGESGWENDFRLMMHFLSGDVYVGGSSRTDNITANRFNEFTFDAEDDYVKNVFTAFYETVYACNILLENTTDDTPVKKQMIAETKVIRAYTYIYLTMLWGTPPLVDHTLTESEYAQPNCDRETLWKFIETDLNDAISSGCLLSKESVEQQRTDRRVTKEFAEALLGKAYLFQNKNAEAAEEFDKVINSGKYALWTGTYRDMFKANNELNCENIFQISEVNDPAIWGGWSNFYPLLICWRSNKMTNLPFKVPGAGWGYCPPRESLYNAFVEEEGKDGYRLNNCILTYDQVREMGASVISPMMSDKYFLWKNIYTEDEMVNMARTHRDYVMMRYAEVLLLAAEANVKTGNQEKADKYVNMIRERAHLSPITGVTLEDVKKEKRLELFLEMNRFIDLVRWGDAPKYLGNIGDTYPVLDEQGNVTYLSTGNTSYGFKEGKNELLPFPSTEIRLNKELKQNPGY